MMVDYLLIAFAIFLILSTAFSVDIYTSIVGAWTRYTGLLAWLSYLSIFIFFDRYVDYRSFNILKFFKRLYIASLIVAIYGFMQHFDFDIIFKSQGLVSSTSSFAFFDNPNFYGTYLVLTMAIGFGLYLFALNKNQLLFYFISINFLVGILLYTYTRSAWIGIIVVLFMLTFTYVRYQKLWKRWSILIFAMIVMAIFINSSENGRYFGKIGITVQESNQLLENGLSGHEGSSRLIIWNKSFPLIKDYFWLGSGVDTHGIVFPATPDELEEYFNDRQIIIDKAHNEYLQLAVTVGVPALIVYLSLIFMIFKRVKRVAKKMEKESSLILCVLVAAICGYLVQAFFNINVVGVAPFYWAFLGIAYGYSTHILVVHNNNSNLSNK